MFPIPDPLAFVGHFTLALPGDSCPACAACAAAPKKSPLRASKGVEVGHVFYLGQKYSKLLGANILNAQQKRQPIEMGCFGIGVTRILAAAVETSHDAEGIVWPEAIAPYRACIVSAGSPAQDAHCRRLYAALVARCETMRGELVLDDRPFGDFRFGAKMKDATLIGFPWVIIGGKSVEAAAAAAAPSASSSADDTAVRFEVLHRASGERRMMTTAELVDLFQ